MKHCKDCLWWLPNRTNFQDIHPRQCTNLKIYVPVRGEMGCDYHLGADSTEANIAQHTKRGTPMVNPNPVDGPLEILIVTYVKDIGWLEFCLRSIEKFCRGFARVIVAHPVHQSEPFGLLAKRFNIHLHPYREVPHKGMLQHMVKMSEAEKIVLPSTKYVLTCDADCIFRMETTPEHYFWDDKPYYIYRTWASLTTEDPRNPGSKVVSDCAQWKGPTDRQLGFDSEIYGMCMNTVVFPVEFYPKYRAHIETVHHRSFAQFMLDGRNEFPQSNMDFTAMGAFAWHRMRERWHWFNVETPPYPEDRKRAYWSHGGITPEIRDEIEGVLK